MTGSKNNLSFILKSLIVMALWGSLFPCVKMSYGAFGIESVGDLLFFAGVRFTICGAVIMLYRFITAKNLFKSIRPVIATVLISGLFSVVLHYAFTYSALKFSRSSALVAILKQVGMVFYVCFSFLFFKEDKPTIIKFIAALAGFAGIIVINITPEGIDFGLGEVLVILASFSSVFSNVFGKKAISKADSVWVTGVSQFFGGVILLAAGYLMGGSMVVSYEPRSLIFVYILFASVFSYCLWYKILETHDLSKMFIIKFAEPLFATAFGMLIAGESFKIQYIIGFLFISLGITLTNIKKDKIKK